MSGRWDYPNESAQHNAMVARHGLHLSQVQLAQVAGVGVTSVRRLEAGGILRPAVALRIARTLGLDVTKFMEKLYEEDA